jgi:hypothetical protein
MVGELVPPCGTRFLIPGPPNSRQRIFILTAGFRLKAFPSYFSQ